MKFQLLDCLVLNIEPENLKAENQTFLTVKPEDIDEWNKIELNTPHQKTQSNIEKNDEGTQALRVNFKDCDFWYLIGLQKKLFILFV